MGKTRGLVFIWLSLLMIGTSVAGCGSDAPDPSATQWKMIEVEYCVGAPPNVVMKTWSTEDVRVLNALRQAFTVNKKEGLSIIPTMETNRIAVSLSDGSKLIMYIYTEGSMSYYDSSNRQRSYSLDIGYGFVDTLREAIRNGAGDAAEFYYDREVSIKRQ